MGVKISSLSDVKMATGDSLPSGKAPVHEKASTRSFGRLEGSESVVVGILDATDFEFARPLMPELQTYVDYSDWLDVRQGAQMGLAMAGVDARVVTVDFQRFISWCENCRVAPSESALDAYARMVAELARPAQGRP